MAGRERVEGKMGGIQREVREGEGGKKRGRSGRRSGVEDPKRWGRRLNGGKGGRKEVRGRGKGRR